MGALDNNRRKHDHLRVMVNDACNGVIEPIQERIKSAARKAYYLGCRDGMELAREARQAAKSSCGYIGRRVRPVSKGEDVKAYRRSDRRAVRTDRHRTILP